jgi:hypothetical protein
MYPDTRSKQLGTLPRLAQHVLAEEREHGLVPDRYVSGLEDPVVLVQ